MVRYEYENEETPVLRLHVKSVVRCQEQLQFPLNVFLSHFSHESCRINYLATEQKIYATNRERQS